jgi:hypothetical protein
MKKKLTETERIAQIKSDLARREAKLAEREARRASKDVRNLERDRAVVLALTDGYDADQTLADVLAGLDAELAKARAAALNTKAGA